MSKKEFKLGLEVCTEVREAEENVGQMLRHSEKFFFEMVLLCSPGMPQTPNPPV